MLGAPNAVGSSLKIHSHDGRRFGLGKYEPYPLYLVAVRIAKGRCEGGAHGVRPSLFFSAVVLITWSS
jgi:hypothetical protein